MRLGVGLWLPMGGKFSTSPPVIDWDWQGFDMTNGTDGVQWVGYSSGTDNTPNPPFGSITSQPSSVTPLLALYDDTASGVVLAVFDGDYSSSLVGLDVSIGGYVLESYEVELVARNTWVRFSDMPGDWVSGETYEVIFGFNLTSQQ